MILVASWWPGMGCLKSLHDVGSFLLRRIYTSYSRKEVMLMTSMETINNIHIGTNDISDFLSWFNYEIQTYGSVCVAHLMMEIAITHWDENYTDFAYGWTEQINGEDHFEIKYSKYADKVPFFKLNLPNYKCLKD